MFAKDQIIDGFAVTEISGGMSFLNPALYKQCIIAGGAMAITANGDMSNDSIMHKNGHIVYMDELKEYMTPEAFNAVIAHEMGHIANGDVDMTEQEKAEAKKLKVVCKDEFEFRADDYAVKLYGAQAMLDAIDQMQRFQIKKMLHTDNKYVTDIILFLNKFSMLGRRTKRLKAML